MENTLWNDPTDISQTSAGNRARRALLACSAVVVLASCSAGPADSTDAGGTNSPAPSGPSTSSASPTPVPSSASAKSTPLHEPLSPDSRSYPPEELVLSEQGTGSGSYVVEGGLREGDSITIAVTCTPGGKLDVKTDPALPGIKNLDCVDGPVDMNISDPAIAGEIGDLLVTVQTSNGGSFWVQARVHSGA